MTDATKNVIRKNAILFLLNPTTVLPRAIFIARAIAMEKATEAMAEATARAINEGINEFTNELGNAIDAEFKTNGGYYYEKD